MWRFLKKLEIELPYDPAIPLLGIHTEETRSERDTCTPMFIAALFIIVKALSKQRPRSHRTDGEGSNPLWYSCLEKSRGWRSLVGCSPRGLEESDMTERLHFHFSLSCIGEGNGNPLQCSCLENPRDGGAWWAAIYGVAQSWTRRDLVT